MSLNQVIHEFESSFSIDFSPEDVEKQVNSALRDLKLKKARNLLQDACMKLPSEDLESRLHEIESILDQIDRGDWTIFRDHVLLKGGLRIMKSTWEKLLPHQKDGVKWMYGIFQHQKGGILADEMGLGKTVQVSCFLNALFTSRLINDAIIVVPLGLLDTWQKHLEEWLPLQQVVIFHGANTKSRKGLNELANIRHNGGVCVTTYDATKTNLDKLSNRWDIMVVDEGHYLKNHRSQRAQAIREIMASKKLLLSGTPLQNNLDEVWSLFDFLTDGRLLGDHRSFVAEYSNPISAGSAKDATDSIKALSEAVAQELRDLISPLFLRREKNVLDGESILSQIGKKMDVVVWCDLTPFQKKIYEEFLAGSQVAEVLNKSNSPFGALSVLFKILAHPLLLTRTNDEEPVHTNFMEPILAAQNDPIGMESQSSKIQALVDLLQQFSRQGHRALVFSQSARLLDIIQRVLQRHGFKFIRMDGSITSTATRQTLIDSFNNDKSILCFLLTTKLGIGITLTGADRVIMMDSSWNPSQDAQSVDRAHRVGQRNNVIVYRLIGCGTFEEKIYRNQIRKMFLAKTLVGKSNTRYFSKAELVQLFTLGDTTQSKTQEIMDKYHPLFDGVDDVSKREVTGVKQFRYVAALSRHDTLFSLADQDTLPELTAEQVKEMIRELESVGIRRGFGTPVKPSKTLETKKRPGTDIFYPKPIPQTPRGTMLLDSDSDDLKTPIRRRLHVMESSPTSPSAPTTPSRHVIELSDSDDDLQSVVKQRQTPRLPPQMMKRANDLLSKSIPKFVDEQRIYAMELLDILLEQ